tara:strand:- start:1931 stop:2248 length:318 start_codon:yes stop_codon:yes gene_type:complete
MDSGRRKFLKFGLATGISTALGAGTGLLKNAFADENPLEGIDFSKVNLSPDQVNNISQIIREEIAKDTLSNSTLNGLILGTGVGVGMILTDKDPDTPENDTITPS